MEKYSDNLNDPFSQYLIQQYVPTIIFLNPKMDILYLNGNADKILTLPKAITQLNIERMVDTPAFLIFKNGVAKALATNEVHLFENIVFTKNNKETHTNILFQKVKLPQLSEEVVMIEIQEINTSGRKNIKTQAVGTDKNLLYQEEISKLQFELKTRNEQVGQLTEQMKNSNEELKANNREMLSNNEELQSMNEELHTVNAELTYKIEELTTANNDIFNLLKSTEIATIFLDKRLRIRRFTPAIQQQFDFIETDINRPITAFSHRLKEVDLEELCHKVYKESEVHEQEVIDKQGNSFLLRILPYRTADDEVEGVVLTFLDIQNFKTELEMAKETYISFMKNAQHQIALIDKDGIIVDLNYAQHSGKSENELIGEKIYNLIPPGEVANYKKSVEEIFAGKSNSKISFKYINKDKLEMDVTLIATPVLVKGQVAYVALIGDPI